MTEVLDIVVQHDWMLPSRYQRDDDSVSFDCDDVYHSDSSHHHHHCPYHSNRYSKTIVVTTVPTVHERYISFEQLYCHDCDHHHHCCSCCGCSDVYLSVNQSTGHDTIFVVAGVNGIVRMVVGRTIVAAATVVVVMWLVIFRPVTGPNWRCLKPDGHFYL